MRTLLLKQQEGFLLDQQTAPPDITMIGTAKNLETTVGLKAANILGLEK